jgi:hypothetical protein
MPSPILGISWLFRYTFNTGPVFGLGLLDTGECVSSFDSVCLLMYCQLDRR